MKERQYSSVFILVMCLSKFIQYSHEERPNPCMAPLKRVEELTTGINSVLPGYWIRLNHPEAICVMAKGNSPGEVSNKYGGFIGAVKLVHLYGKVTCDLSNKDYYSNWGCSRANARQETEPLNMHITDSKNNVLFSGREDLQVDWYKLDGFEPDSSELVLSRMKDPPYIPKGEVLKVWYGEDLRNIDEGNNEGMTCFDVYVHFI